jgi:hypothetical protein
MPTHAEKNRGRRVFFSLKRANTAAFGLYDHAAGRISRNFAGLQGGARRPQKPEVQPGPFPANGFSFSRRAGAGNSPATTTTTSKPGLGLQVGDQSDHRVKNRPGHPHGPCCSWICFDKMASKSAALGANFVPPPRGCWGGGEGFRPLLSPLLSPLS